jgi:hypothetical protein
MRGPAWLDIACSAVRQGNSITRRRYVQALSEVQEAGTSASLHRIPTTANLAGFLAGGRTRTATWQFRGFEARFVGWVRRHCLHQLAKFKARYLASHLCTATTGRQSFDRIGCRQVCLIGEAYRLCNIKIGVSRQRPRDVKKWPFDAAADLAIFAIQLRVLLDIFSREEFLRTLSASQSNDLLKWFAQEVAELVVLRSLESSLTGVLLDYMSLTLYGSRPPEVIPPYLFPGEAAFTPIVLAIEGRPTTITMHSRTELSAENWQRVAACTQLCDLLSSQRPDPASLCDLLEFCGLTELRNIAGRTIREDQLAEWRRREEEALSGRDD